MSWTRIDISGTVMNGIDSGLTTVARTATQLWATSPALAAGIALAIFVAVLLTRPTRV